MFKQKRTALYLSIFASSVAAQYTATYLPQSAPDHTENGQSGTNKCGTTSSQDSMCQNAYINSLDDFCLWGPPNPNSAVGNAERIMVAWCTKSGYGTRVMPEGTVSGAHFVKTPDFVQVTGAGDFTKINILRNDPGGGGELDPHGADGNGNPVGGLVFSNAYGNLQQMHEWTNFMSDTDFCFRACKPGNTKSAQAWCQHIYDVMGCEWNMPANYDANVFEECDGDSGQQPMGVYGTSTFHQGDPNTPAPHPIPSSSNCVSSPTLVYGDAATALTAAPVSTSGSTTITTSASGSASTASSSVPSSSGGANSQASSRTTTGPASSSTGSASSPSSKTSNSSSPSSTPSSAATSVNASLLGGLVGAIMVGMSLL